MSLCFITPFTWNFGYQNLTFGIFAVIIDFPGRIVMGLFGKAVPKTAGWIFVVSILILINCHC